MKSAALLLATLWAGAAYALGGQRVSDATFAYQQLRLQVTEPPYGLAKVKSLIAKTKDNFDGSVALPDATWNSLPLDDKFTYTMIHGEDYHQLCSGMPIFAGEEHMIFAHPANFMNGGERWSDRETGFLLNNQSIVTAYLKNTIQRTHQVGMNIKQAIIELHAKELIPEILAVYNRDHKDLDILSTCLVLMKDAGYSGLTKSALYAPLYGPNANYQSRVSATAANRTLVEDLAIAFYLGHGDGTKMHYYYIGHDKPPKK